MGVPDLPLAVARVVLLLQCVGDTNYRGRVGAYDMLDVRPSDFRSCD